MPPTAIGAQSFSALQRALADRSGVRLAVVFGSRARGQEAAGSDLDLAVDAPGMDLLALAAELSAAVGQELDVVSLEDPPIPLLEEILNDGLVIHELHPGIGATWRSHVLASLEIDRPWYARMREAWLHRLAERGLR